MKIKEVSAIALYDNEGRILIQHRTYDAPTSPNQWGFFGGGIEEGETPLQAVKRETFEELDIRLKNPKLFLKEHINIEGKEHCVYFYMQKIEDKNKIILKEGQNMKWIFQKEIDNYLTKPYVKRIIKIIAEKLD